MAGADKLERRDPVIRELKKLKPVGLKATLADGKEQKLAWRADVGNKWERLSKLLDSIEWEYVDALDAEGGVLGRVERPDDEDADESFLGEMSPAAIASYVLDAAKAGMREARLGFAVQVDGFSAQMDGVAKLVVTMNEGMQQVVDSFKTAMNVQSATMAMQQVANTDGDPEVKNMLETLFKVMMFSKQQPIAAQSKE